MSFDDDDDRRSFLKAAGSAAAATAIAGCLSGGPGSGDNGTDGNGTEGTGTSGNETADSTDSGGNGGGGQASGTLVWGRGAFPTNYDPQQTTSGEVVKVTNQVFNQLIQFVPGGGGKLEAGLATQYSLDGTTATLKLREGVKFHNGDEFTAADFKATYRRFVDDSYQYHLGKESVSGKVSAYGPFTLGNWVKSVTTKGKYDLEIELSQKYAPFLRNLAMFASSVLSKKQIEKLGKNQEKLGKNPIGTGPFTFEQIESGTQRVQLARNGDFWGEGPFVKQVVFSTIKKNSTRASSVLKGESHIIDGIGAEAATRLQNSDGASLVEKNGINIGYMAMNMSRMKQFRKKKVRKAISYAVNTKAIVNQIYQGFAKQADQPIPPNVLGYNDSIDPYPRDTEKAKKLLEEAGYGDGFSFELATFSNPRGYNPSPIQTANQVKSDLADVGLNAKINQFSTFSSYLDYTSAGKHDACFLGWYTDNADPDNFYYTLLHPGVDKSKIPEGQDWVPWDTKGYNTNNASAWANRKFMDLITKAQTTYKTSERKSLYQQAGKLSHDEAPWVYIDYAKTLRGVSEQVMPDSYVVSSIGGPYLSSVKLKG